MIAMDRNPKEGARDETKIGPNWLRTAAAADDDDDDDNDDDSNGDSNGDGDGDVDGDVDGDDDYSDVDDDGLNYVWGCDVDDS